MKFKIEITAKYDLSKEEMEDGNYPINLKRILLQEKKRIKSRLLAFETDLNLYPSTVKVKVTPIETTGPDDNQDRPESRQ